MDKLLYEIELLKKKKDTLKSERKKIKECMQSIDNQVDELENHFVTIQIDELFEKDQNTLIVIPGYVPNSKTFLAKFTNKLELLEDLRIDTWNAESYTKSRNSLEDFEHNWTFTYDEGKYWEDNFEDKVSNVYYYIPDQNKLVLFDDFIKYIEENCLCAEYKDDDIDYGDWDSYINVRTKVDNVSYGIITKEKYKDLGYD
tara:strand:+ start:2921 stop:3520 length:600 start_codon:yes stop_codon:yes gene_type:complete